LATIVSDNCNANTHCFGVWSDSVSGEREKDFLTSATNFNVKEIEIFEIAD
jgi:hypothetical protein